MYCIKCGTQLIEEANYCQLCGTKTLIDHSGLIKNTEQELIESPINKNGGKIIEDPKINPKEISEEPKEPVWLIVFTGLFIILSFLPIPNYGVQVVISLIILPLSIALIASKTIFGKTIGIIVLIIWIITFFIGFIGTLQLTGNY